MSLYLKEMLMHSYSYEVSEAEDLAAIIFHVFITLSFIMALFGAFLADSVIGKYRLVAKHCNMTYQLCTATFTKSLAFYYRRAFVDGVYVG